MIGGLAVRGNLLCVTWSAGRGHVFLYDLDARERVSSWTTPVGASGYSDAGGVAIDAHFRIFVADPHNHCVRRYNAFGQHLGDLGEPPVGEVAGGGRERPGVLEAPHACAVLGDRVYVACGERPRRRAVACYRVEGQPLRGLPARGDAAHEWGAPRGIWADERGLVVADTLRGRLQRFRPDGTFVHEVALPADRGEARPGAVARLADGRIAVVDHGAVEPRLVVVDADGRSQTPGELGDRIRDPLALTRDDAGRLYVLDHDGERVVRATSTLGFDEVLLDLAEHDRDAPGGP